MGERLGQRDPGLDLGLGRDPELERAARALRESWAADTCSPDDADRAPWSGENPAWGHCDVTALVVHDRFGGELVCGEVFLDGEQRGYHWWNRLEDGREVDLTREQFRRGETVTEGRRVPRPPGRPRRRAAEYELLRERVEAWYAAYVG